MYSVRYNAMMTYSENNVSILYFKFQINLFNTVANLIYDNAVVKTKFIQIKMNFINLLTIQLYFCLYNNMKEAWRESQEIN